MLNWVPCRWVSRSSPAILEVRLTRDPILWTKNSPCVTDVRPVNKVCQPQLICRSTRSATKTQIQGGRKRTSAKGGKTWMSNFQRTRFVIALLYSRSFCMTDIARDESAVLSRRRSPRLRDGGASDRHSRAVKRRPPIYGSCSGAVILGTLRSQCSGTAAAVACSYRGKARISGLSRN